MALDDFWMSVRAAARLPVAQSLVDSPRLDAEAIDLALRKTLGWLSPGAVAGFVAEDFSFLADAERLRLAKLISDFLTAVTTKSGPAPPRGDLIEKTLPIFRGIVQALEFDRYGDPTAFRLGKHLVPIDGGAVRARGGDMSLHADLLDQAEHLAQLDQRRPKQASLRRAVSSAYYALFQSDDARVYLACFQLWKRWDEDPR